MYSNLMSLISQFVDHRVISVFVGHEECCMYLKYYYWNQYVYLNFKYLVILLVLNKLTTFTGQPFGFLRVCGKSLLLYSRQFSSLIASSNVMVTIWGTSVGDNPPGTRVPSLEHQQSGNVQLL